MKKALFLLVVLAWGCGQSAVEKPDNLIDEATMVDILYDLSVLEAMKTRDAKLSDNSSAGYVYKKYNIDSVQFAHSNQYYAAEIEKYRKIYEKVDARLQAEKTTADSLAKKEGRTTPTPPGDPGQIK